ncbi:ABC transporter substrate-binding protein [Microlunatus soli]|uniref:Iron(III) transport system substrate-binding protein n=1 Tax=Microlunatus soli TaxID=630515 RepID=A0A1H1PE92_9ACTN|nr:substrate-binding domain-containing protein [Microlunatus soli]SDS08939.1 iron(III) transport system substrate-binding protein [Microlunatus soli]
MTAPMMSRRALLRSGTAAAGLLTGGALLGCEPPQGAVGEAVPPLPRPDYYPADYDRIVDGSRGEGRLTIYSNMDTFNWKPIVDGFQQHYPWITDVATTNLGSSQVFQRQLAEEAAGQQKAGLLVSGSPQNWLDLTAAKKVADYHSPELDHLPSFARPRPGLYTFSADVMIMVYNKLLLGPAERPDSISGLIRLVRREPDRFRHKLTTYAAGLSFGLAIHDSYYRTRRRRGEDGWAPYDALLPYTRAEESSGPMLDKLASGEYLIAFFLSSTVLFPQRAQLDRVVTWKFARDATPLFQRGMGIPASSPTPNSGRLMLDYVLSREGQQNVAQGGFTPYRDDVPASAAHPSFASIRQQVGSDDLVMIGYDFGSQQEQDDFVEQWERRLG